MKRTLIAGLFAAAWLTAQTGPVPDKPTDPGVLHPMPIPKTTPPTVPPGTQPDPSTQNRAKTEKSQPSRTKKKTTPKKGTESPKARTETSPQP